jgi:hypothetical protein
VRRVYLRCNSGHYYSSVACPIDGWIFDGAAELLTAAMKLEKNNEPLSIEKLLDEGVPRKAIDRAIVVDFGSEAAMFEALVPESYIVKRGFIKLSELGSEFN